MKTLYVFTAFLVFSVFAACSSGGGGGGSGGPGGTGTGGNGTGGNGTGGLPDQCAGCTAPPICGTPPDPCSCFCTEGETAQYPDGIYVCHNGCFEPQGADAGACVPTPEGRLCVRGTPDPQTGQEALTVNGPVEFQVMPKGCFSSSCTKIHEATCSVMLDAAGNFAVQSSFCLENLNLQACTDDCNGGGFANCSPPSGNLGAGTYTATLGNLNVTFTIPSQLPPGGACAGMQF